jgi:hypothetical protein
MAKSQIFRVDNSQRKLVDAMLHFYKCTTHNQVFLQVLLFHAIDIANLKENKSWTREQKKAWLYCKKVAEEIKQVIILQSAKKALKKQKPDAKITIPQLADKTKKELQNATKS